jgi:hypothetical protein
MKVVKENHACFSCLKRAGRDHKVSNCTQRRRQRVEEVDGSQCKYYHHPLLHEAKKKNPPTIASVLNNNEAMLPIVEAEIVGAEGMTKRGNVLLDSGAQISLIKSTLL